MKVFTVTVQKGGTGKSTTAAALAQAAAYRGEQALAIDLDPQGNLSFALATRAGNPEANSYNLLVGSQAADKNIVASGTGFNGLQPQGLDVIPASPNLAALTSSTGSARRLQKAIEPLKSFYDFIIIDTPAGGEMQYNALQAADGLIIPLHPDSFNIQSLYQIIDIAEQFKKSNPALTVAGVLMTRYDKRTQHARQIRDAIKQQCEALELPYLGEVRQTIAVQEAVSLMKSLYIHKPGCTAAQDYLEIFDIITR